MVDVKSTLILTFFTVSALINLPQYSLADKLENACRFTQFRCEGGTLCLDTEKLCNGVEDCPQVKCQREDEKGTEQYDCTRSTLSDDCKPGEFRCRFGGCIANNLRCDGKPDCWGGTDEATDFCGFTRPGKKPMRVPVSSRPSTSTSTSTAANESQNPDPEQISTRRNQNQNQNQNRNPVEQNESRRPVQRIPSSTSRTTTTERTTTAQVPTVSNIPARRTPPTQKVDVEKPSATKPPTTRTTTTTTTKSPSSSTSHVKQAAGSCPIIELDPGQKVSCFQQKLALEIHCSEIESPELTQAEITCDKYWSPPETGPSRTVKQCKNGRWVGGGSNYFGCELDCGQGGYPPVGLVTGGTASVQGKWPWHVGLYESDPPGSDNYRHICGATLVTRQAVVTAAHCVTFPSTNTKKNADDLILYFGKFFRVFDQNNEHVQSINVKEIVVHPDYNFAQLESDIAILRLENPVEVTSFVHPVCMPPEDFIGPLVGDAGSLAGWGSLGDRNYPKTLQEATLPVKSNHECSKNSLVLANLVRDSTFCAGFNNGTSACDGDSGGGLVFPDEDNTKKWTILGVVSGGVPKAGGRGCDPKYYAAFTKVSTFRRWIDRVLDKFSYRRRR